MSTNGLLLLSSIVVCAAIEAQEAAELDDGTTMTVHLEPGLDEIFDEGTRRLLIKSTWKLWQWPPEEREFFDADSFRCNLGACLQTVNSRSSILCLCPAAFSTLHCTEHCHYHVVLAWLAVMAF